MTRANVTIEAMNPVNKSNIDVIIQKITAIDGVSSAHLVSDDQYKFVFKYDYDSEVNNDIIMNEIKSLLNLYYSAILSKKQDKRESGLTE